MINKMLVWRSLLGLYEVTLCSNGYAVLSKPYTGEIQNTPITHGGFEKVMEDFKIPGIVRYFINNWMKRNELY